MAKLVIRFGLDTMVPDTKDKLIAPKISTLAAPKIPDISAERKQFVAAFVLNFDLSLSITNRHRQLLFNIIRKAEDALDEYCRAAESLNDYVKRRGLTLQPYFAALRSFEHCVAHLYHAVCCMNALSEIWHGQKQFDRDDGSILQRVYLVHTEIKHMDERFARGSVADETSFMLLSRTRSEADTATTANVPIWLTDEGIECAKAHITYTELAQELSELCQEAGRLATLKPHQKSGDAKT